MPWMKRADAWNNLSIGTGVGWCSKLVSLCDLCGLLFKKFLGVSGARGRIIFTEDRKEHEDNTFDGKGPTPGTTSRKAHWSEMVLKDGYLFVIFVTFCENVS